jgi:hypothetical protein
MVADQSSSTARSKALVCLACPPPVMFRFVRAALTWLKSVGAVGMIVGTIRIAGTFWWTVRIVCPT